jgi:hypothetical protein
VTGPDEGAFTEENSMKKTISRRTRFVLAAAGLVGAIAIGGAVQTGTAMAAEPMVPHVSCAVSAPRPTPTPTKAAPTPRPVPSFHRC